MSFSQNNFDNWELSDLEPYEFTLEQANAHIATLSVSSPLANQHAIEAAKLSYKLTLPILTVEGFVESDVNLERIAGIFHKRSHEAKQRDKGKYATELSERWFKERLFAGRK